MEEGFVFDIQRFSIHDGPGIRTTVFLKGCPLSCLWCHNPESHDPAPEIFFTAGKCIGCLFCVRACERKCHRIEEGLHVFDRRSCIRCGACLVECYPRALEVVGRTMSVEEVLVEVRKDRAFYDQSGGGMTVSGGEPLAQFAFTQALMEGARRDKLHTCLETSGLGPRAHVLALAPLVDLFLWDYKETDEQRHRQYTGVAAGAILENLHALDGCGAPITLRCPIIPGFNDRADHFRGIAQTANALRHVVSIEVQPYHPLGRSKSQRLGRTHPLADLSFAEDQVVEFWIEAIRKDTQVPVRRLGGGKNPHIAGGQ